MSDVGGNELIRKPLKARTRLGSFFCAVPRRCVRREQAKKVSGARRYFVNGSEEGNFVGFRWLVEAAHFLKNCNDAARISSFVTGGWKLKSVLMFRHIIVYLDISESRNMKWC